MFRLSKWTESAINIGHTPKELIFIQQTTLFSPVPAPASPFPGTARPSPRASWLSWYVPGGEQRNQIHQWTYIAVRRLATNIWWQETINCRWKVHFLLVTCAHSKKKKLKMRTFWKEGKLHSVAFSHQEKHRQWPSWERFQRLGRNQDVAVKEGFRGSM